MKSTRFQLLAALLTLITAAHAQQRPNWYPDPGLAQNNTVLTASGCGSPANPPQFLWRIYQDTEKFGSTIVPSFDNLRQVASNTGDFVPRFGTAYSMKDLGNPAQGFSLVCSDFGASSCRLRSFIWANWGARGRSTMSSSVNVTLYALDPSRTVVTESVSAACTKGRSDFRTELIFRINNSAPIFLNGATGSTGTYDRTITLPAPQSPGTPFNAGGTTYYPVFRKNYQLNIGVFGTIVREAVLESDIRIDASLVGAGTSHPEARPLSIAGAGNQAGSNVTCSGMPNCSAVNGYVLPSDATPVMTLDAWDPDAGGSATAPGVGIDTVAWSVNGIPLLWQCTAGSTGSLTSPPVTLREGKNVVEARYWDADGFRGTRSVNIYGTAPRSGPALAWPTLLSGGAAGTPALIEPLLAGGGSTTLGSFGLAAGPGVPGQAGILVVGTAFQPRSIFGGTAGPTDDLLLPIQLDQSGWWGETYDLGVGMGINFPLYVQLWTVDRNGGLVWSNTLESAR